MYFFSALWAACCNCFARASIPEPSEIMTIYNSVELQTPVVDNDNERAQVNVNAVKTDCCCFGRPPVSEAPVTSSETRASTASRISSACCLSSEATDSFVEPPQKVAVEKEDVPLAWGNTDNVTEGCVDDLLAVHVGAVPECGLNVDRQTSCRELPQGDSRSTSAADSDSDSAKSSIQSVDYQDDSYVNFMRGVIGPLSPRKRAPDFTFSSDEDVISLKDGLIRY